MSETEKDTEKQTGTAARDHPDNEDLDKRGQAVSDQSGENAPAGADEPEGGGS